MTTQKRIDQFANRIAARLEGGGVPHDVSERLLFFNVSTFSDFRSVFSP